jgi:hypothetical protein
MPTRGASAGQLNRRRGSGRVRVRAMDRPELGGADLISVALLVFFASLVATVGALLALPLLY